MLLDRIDTVLLDNLFEGAYVVDRERRILYWNRAAELITGFSMQELEGRLCPDAVLKHVNDAGEMMCFKGCPLDRALLGRDPSDEEAYLRHRGGHRVPVSVRVIPIRDENREVVGAVEIFRDRGRELEHKERIEALEKIAFIDSLTGLANRRFLMSEIDRRLEELRRYGWPLGLLFIDVDHFKSINDNYGHDVGDAVLKMVASTIRASMRIFDFASRYGGEEFVVLISNVTQEHLREIAERLRMLVSFSVLRDPEQIRTTVSIGAAMALEIDTSESLIKRADEKLYEAKRAGRNSVFA